MNGSAELVERDRELASLSEVVDALARGEGGMALIEGPAGIGKTRLLAAARELAGRARAALPRPRPGAGTGARQSLRPGRGGLPRGRGRGRRGAGAPARAGPGDGHLRGAAAGRDRRAAHGPTRPDAGGQRAQPARAARRGRDRCPAGDGRGRVRLHAASVELRHLGGALGRVSAGAGALGRLPGEFAMFAVGIAAGPETTAATEADLARVAATLAPYKAGHYLNFVEEKTQAEGAFEPETAARLLAARAAYDPERRLHPNHEIGARR